MHLRLLVSFIAIRELFGEFVGLLGEHTAVTVSANGKSVVRRVPSSMTDSSVQAHLWEDVDYATPSSKIKIEEHKLPREQTLAGIPDPPDDIVVEPVMEWTSGDKDHAEMPDYYGHDGPRIHGLDKCEAYRGRVNKMGGAGLPNSGTNALYHMMAKNCDASFGWEVPWHKHEMLHTRPRESDATVLPIVLVKDPFQWMASTCRKPYFSVNLPPSTSCPSPVNTTSATLSQEGFESLIELWSKWVLEYMNADIPALVVRFEDLLFAPEALISQVCGCLGFQANSSSNFQILESIPKWGRGHGQPSNRTETIARFTTKRSAIMHQYTAADKLYIRSILKKYGAESVMSFFHYSLDMATDDTELHLHSSASRALLSTLDWGEGEDDISPQMRSP